MRRQYDVIKKTILFLVGFLVVVILCGSAYILLYSPLTRIQEIRTERTDQRIDIEVVQLALAPIFGRHIALLQEQDIVALLKKHVPDLHNVYTEKEYPSLLRIRLELEPLVAQVHITEEDADHSVSGYLTEQGTYIEYANVQVKNYDTLSQITIVDWGVRPQPGSKLVQPEFLRRMWSAETLLREQFGQVITERKIFLRAREFHLKIKGDIWLWFDDQGESEEQIKQYQIFLQSVPMEDVKEYVDLRLSDRVIYQ
ncbi:hypothetical protein A3D11_01830 [Candidatus Peribacteria bacterium RIFCSPHIGHO2_02_FULL_49_16]|nr:MAG: hypothetical protein A2880_00940 [Candidatus Peribacteria bacterium RIFCSPHIGHO2_01_FULL_49_38]OGJ58656.1 MAG: hypothetical protein A3D11_01830 [Candidatus Peribacteria bacterium RIFCSPHIGHO2_02_FULL_49_16]